jgi:hypothetical protein
MYPDKLLYRCMILRNNEPIVKWLIQWANLPDTTVTWEDVDSIRKIFPEFNPWGQGSQEGGIVSTALPEV